MLTSIILTKNSVLSIRKCLKSLLFSDEIVIIDDYSTDETKLLVRKIVKQKNYPNLRILQRHLKNDFSSQRNFAMHLAKNSWVLFVDSDEEVSLPLQKEILKSINSKSIIDGYFFTRTDFFMGKKMQFGETSRVRLLRLVRKGAGNWQGKVHEKLIVKGKTDTLKSPLIHHHNLSIKNFIKRINWYSTLAAKDKITSGKRFSFFQFFLYPIGKFIYNYFICFGFLDRTPGFIMAYLMSLHSLLVRTKMYQMGKNDAK